jgi:hypothetical protein
VLVVGQLDVQIVCAVPAVLSACPQHTCPDGQSTAPPHMMDAVNAMHAVPCGTHMPVGMLVARFSPRQHVLVDRSQVTPAPHATIVGWSGEPSPEAPASLTVLPLPEADPEWEPLVEPEEPEPEEPECDPADDPDPLPLPAPASSPPEEASSPPCSGVVGLLQATAAVPPSAAQK